MGTPGIRVSAPRRISKRAPGVAAVLAAALVMALFTGCGRDFQNPFLPPAIPVQSVKVPDMSITLLTEGDDRLREPSIAWTPPEATDKGYSLHSDKPEVVRVVGGSVELLRQGEAKITITSDDGNKRDTFKVKVAVLIPCGTLYSCDDEDDSGED